MSRDEDALGFADKARLSCRVWASYVQVRARLHRSPLPVFVADLAASPPSPGPRYAPVRLGRAVDRSLRLGPLRPTCLASALVLFRLLRRQGDAAELVLGLPGVARDEKAHAWIEVEGCDVGPAPGRGDHVEMARFG